MKIEKGIPIPKIAVGQKKKLDPRDQLQVGDSYVVEGKTPPQVRSSVVSFAERRGYEWKFAVRKQPDGSVRVWRVK